MRSLQQCLGARGVSGALIFLLLLLLVPTSALGQTETGRIIGSVTDPQGAVVAGADVTVRNVDTGATRTTRTSEDGNFTVTNLQPGRYEVAIKAAGFAGSTQAAQVNVGQPTSIDIALNVAGSGETVDVVAGEEGVSVNTENQELSTVVSEREIKELPTITRNPYSLISLSGNVSPTDPTGRGAGFSINGQRAAGTNVLLDGADNNDQFTAAVGQQVPLDSVEQFTVLTSNFSAEFGRATAGIVNVATKAGTNEFHGTIFEFNRISRLASRGFELNAPVLGPGDEPLKKGVFTRNQFGYSIGGPIVQDKLLFFNSTEWIRVRSFDTISVVVPTPEFIAASAPETQQYFANFSLAAPITGRIFRRGDIAVTSGPFAALPASFPVFGEVFLPVPTDAGAGSPQNSYQTVSRVDWNISDRTTLYGRYALESENFFEGSNAFSPYQGFNTGATTFNNNFLVSVTRAWSDRFVSQTKFVFNRLNRNDPLGEQPSQPTLFLTAASVTRIGTSIVTLPGYLPYAQGSGIPFGGPQNLAQFYQDQTWSTGDHNIRFGGSYVRIHDDRTFGAYQNASVRLGSNLSQGVNNFLLGQARQFLVAVDPGGAFPFEEVQLPLGPPNFSRQNRYNEGALYVNDAWKIHPRVTLNLGLRWDYFGVQHNADPSLDANFYYGEGSTLQERVANGRFMRAQDSAIGGLWEPDWNNFAPRLGIAWDVFGDGTTSLRGGYGISYERNFGNVTFNVIQNPPNYAVLSITAGEPGFTRIPISNAPLGPFGSGTGTRRLPRTSGRHVDENIRTAYAHFWSAALERQMWDYMVFSAEYSGSKGVDLYSLEDPNGPFSALAYGFAYDPATNPLAYLNPIAASINTRRNNGFSNYNALILSAESRLIPKLGLQFSAKYTWSHAIDNLSSTFSESSNNFNLGVLDPYNPDLDKGDADFDVRQRFVTNGIWQIPVGKDTDGWAKHVIGGWSLNWIFTARTGSPFSIYDCSNAFFRCVRLLQAGQIDADGTGNPRPVDDDPFASNQFVYIDLTNQLANAGSYVHPVAGTNDYGPFPSNMTGRNAFRRPGNWNLDGGIYKNFELTERVGLQLRGEFYNVFNHANLFIDASDVDISSTDRITAFRSGRRQVQLAAKIIF